MAECSGDTSEGKYIMGYDVESMLPIKTEPKQKKKKSWKSFDEVTF